MTATLDSALGYDLFLTPPPLGAAITRRVVARHLGLDADSLLRHLATPGEPIRQGLPGTEATRLQSLLRATGWPATIRPARSAPAVDLSLQPAIWADLSRLSRRLSGLLGREAGSVLSALHRPGGLILPAGDPHHETVQTAARQGLPGLNLISADPATALYDLFPTRMLGPSERAAITRHLCAFETASGGLTGAVAEGLSAPLCQGAMAKLRNAGLIAVNRAFQRFELHLVAVSGWVGRDLADFLALRTGQPRARFEVISPTDPVVLDTALTHAVARQFCADYAAIGLFTRLHLRGLPRNAENPIR
ncbi:hypothetical protein C0V75_04045 [Tabrizicola sp. TH137]|uniref:hypothetical protein n=1 Tax=Tabrizicola sp. TH137 TaxID=2067452 RepID=UPI000C79D032|nr:hypothetical protein [Tabrizicola sp. TH137]PLL14600.1 hypothetical protein C0V75_04045 [Tabrizicola sp. TH137]